jgi:hypothetical protein
MTPARIDMTEGMVGPITATEPTRELVNMPTNIVRTPTKRKQAPPITQRLDHFKAIA